MVELPVLLCEQSHCYNQPYQWFHTPGAAWGTGNGVITSEISFLTRNSSRQMLAATYPSPVIGAPVSVRTASTLCLWGVRRLRVGPCSRRILISGFDLCSGLKRIHHPGSVIVLGCQKMMSFLEKMINYWLVVCIRHLLACLRPHLCSYLKWNLCSVSFCGQQTSFSEGVRLETSECEGTARRLTVCSLIIGDIKSPGITVQSQQWWQRSVNFCSQLPSQPLAILVHF